VEKNRANGLKRKEVVARVPKGEWVYGCSRRFYTGLASLIVLIFVLIPSANAQTCHLYAVNIQGAVTSVSSSQPFSVNQYAVWRDVGFGQHPIDFALLTNQDLNASSQIGQIIVMTNSAWAKNGGIASQRYDLAMVSVANNTVQFQLDSGMSFIMPQPNVFVAPGVAIAPGGLGGLGFLYMNPALGNLFNSAPILNSYYFIPQNGTGYFYTPDNQSIVGELNLSGSSLDNASLQGWYQATFSGTYIRSEVCN